MRPVEPVTVTFEVTVVAAAPIVATEPVIQIGALIGAPTNNDPVVVTYVEPVTFVW
jgi:hypothetical protein